MVPNKFKILLLNLLLQGVLCAQNGSIDFFYLQPKPNAKFINPTTQILLKTNKMIGDLNNRSVHLYVEGSKSGSHEGGITYIDNTIKFKSTYPFALGETVTISLTSPTSPDNPLLEYSFHIRDEIVEAKNLPSSVNTISEQYSSIVDTGVVDDGSQIKIINGVAVPSDLPTLDVSVFTDSSDNGKLFLANYLGTPYLLIYEMDGTPYYYKKLPYLAYDFKVQPTGQLSYWTRDNGKNIFVLDSTFTLTDTLHAVNGYTTNEHECTMRKNGDYFLIVDGFRTVDMSQYVEGGDTEAILKENHIQGFDKDGNLYFEWLCFDHYNILDAKYTDFTSNYIDYMHTNSIAFDYDSNLIVSHRSLCEVTKIDINTGEIIWQLGGKNSDFKFVDYEYGINRQHFAQPVKDHPNQYMVFDNGWWYSDAKFTRVVIFEIDTLQKTATNIWEYRAEPDKYSGWMGNAQELESGNVLINYALSGHPKALEVTRMGSVVYEAAFSEGNHTYRTFKFDYQGNAKKPVLFAESKYDGVNLIFNKFGDTNNAGYIIYSLKHDDTELRVDTCYTPYKKMTDLENNHYYSFQVVAFDSMMKKSSASDTATAFVHYYEMGKNQIINGDFSSGSDFWKIEYADSLDFSYITNKDTLFFDIPLGGKTSNALVFYQNNIVLKKEHTYRLRYDVITPQNRLIEVKIIEKKSPNRNYSRSGPVAIKRTKAEYEMTFTMEEKTDPKACLLFEIGGLDSTEICFDNIELIDITEPTEVEEESRIAEYSLSNNFPNPFNPITNINYTILNKGNVSLKVYSILGEEMLSVVDEIQMPGKHTVAIDMSEFASGVYFYRMITTDLKDKQTHVETKKMVLLK